ncbi:hypothetical protein PCH_Pc13g06910 [Penicillium rubens Wisconsin 54-1255]|uniref:Uncharacterized protein n=1 Tax=Penicillium rubens (strain ATCC 28089 / DSM 1075 / NRRL 1951 / Wisconsin 54-1255) TaxID=500485 RepID=B6H3M5_PENRW|nr:hypothetical protein PCH_Pc13g06910 [Penicillium rubens Wisconsin 54-1255]
MDDGYYQDGCGEVAVIVEHNQRRLMETIEDEAENFILERNRMRCDALNATRYLSTLDSLLHGTLKKPSGCLKVPENVCDLKSLSSATALSYGTQAHQNALAAVLRFGYWFLSANIVTYRATLRVSIGMLDIQRSHLPQFDCIPNFWFDECPPTRPKACAGPGNIRVCCQMNDEISAPYLPHTY